MTGACIYTRFSPRPKEKAEECDSIEKQRERCEAYCKANDYSVVAVYEEREVSGGRADNRPQLQAALDHVCKLKGTLVVYSLDRMARNVDDARAISKRLEKADANLAILQMRVDTTTPYGKLFFTIVAAFAEFYREDIAQRTSKAMLRHQAHGRRMTRMDYFPYGKMPDWNGPMHEASDENGNKVLRPAQLIDCPEEQAIIDRICLEREQGKGLREIARLLDAEGITCRGRRWHHSTIKTILSRIGGDVGRAA